MPTDKRTVNWYDENARAYADHLHTEEGKFHFALEKPAMYAELPNVEGASVMSLGCGPGEDSVHLKACGAQRSVGIDTSSELINIATGQHPECEFYVMSMESLEFDSEEFDFVYSSLAIHYLPTWERVLSEAWRVLKPGGEFLFSAGHPISGAMHQVGDGAHKEMYLGARVDKTTHNVELLGEYLHPKEIKGSDNFGVVIYQRPLSMVMEDVITSEFDLLKFLEPKPTKEMKQISPRHYKLHQTIPFVMIFKLQKPFK